MLFLLQKCKRLKAVLTVVPFSDNTDVISVSLVLGTIISIGLSGTWGVRRRSTPRLNNARTVSGRTHMSRRSRARGVSVDRRARRHRAAWSQAGTALRAEEHMFSQ